MSDDGYVQSNDDCQQYDELHLLEYDQEIQRDTDDHQQCFAFMSGPDSTDDDIVF